MVLWYKVNRDKAHAVLTVPSPNVVEFQCGKVRTFDEVIPAQFNDEQCDECHERIKGGGKNESTG